MESNITLVKDIINLTEQYDRIARAKNLPQRPIPRFDNLQSLNTTLLKKYKISLYIALQEIQEIQIEEPAENPTENPTEEEQVAEELIDPPAEEEEAGEPVDPSTE